MSEKHTLSADVREVLGKKVKRLRREGMLPATVYGKGVEPISLQLDERTFLALYRQIGKTALVTLDIAGHPQISAFVHVLQRHPVTRTIMHVDFKAVDLKKLIHVEVPVVTVGTSPLVARGDALINHVINTVMVEALPAALPQSIEADVSVLDSFDKSIQVKDLPTGDGYKILADADQPVISLTTLRASEEEPEAEGEPTEPELIRKSREDDEGGE